MKKIMEAVSGAKSIGISGHVRPDGDCLGACLSMALYLRKEMPGAQVDVYLEQPGDSFHCMKGIDTILDASEKEAQEKVYDVFICLDCSKERLGDAEVIFDHARKTVNIDHHVSNTGCADINYIKPDASSASELVFEVLEEDKLDASIAENIYIGIMHDTGVMKYSCTKPSTLVVASKLIAFGFDFSKIIEETFYEKTYEQNLIMGRTVSESVLHLNGQCISGIVTKERMQEYGLTGKDLDGIINRLQNTKGVHCSIFIYELEENTYKVSMRSDEYVNVSEIAQTLGGGGHVRAAGCTLEGNVDEILSNVVKEVEKQL